MVYTEFSVTLRQATDADFPLVYAIKKAAMQGHIEQVWGKWDERFQQDYHEKHFDPSVTWIICLEQKEIGYLVVRDYPEYRNLESIHIRPDYQGQGIGSRLMNELMAKAGQDDRPVRLHVLKINPAVGLYKRLKFRIIGETDKHFVMEWRQGEGQD